MNHWANNVRAQSLAHKQTYTTKQSSSLSAARPGCRHLAAAPTIVSAVRVLRAALAGIQSAGTQAGPEGNALQKRCGNDRAMPATTRQLSTPMP